MSASIFSMARQSPHTAMFVALGLVVMLLWSTALFLRSAPFTPDEPREFDIAVNMLHQHEFAVPLLAGEAFCEKPPLLYWASAASMSLFGESVWAARLPNLVWAAITLSCLLSWVRSSLAGAPRVESMFFTTLVATSTLLLFRVQIWLATDAPLVAGNALALLGAWRALNAQTSRARLAGYTLFHLGLATSFFAKNLLGWLVPIGALIGVIVWERRWKEFLRYELYLPLALQVALIAPWIAAVAGRDDGGKLLRVFLFDNTVGRFLPIETEEQYQLGHRNHFAKYLLELPYYLLPWTFAVIAAIRRGIKYLRTDSAPQRAAIRFAFAAIVPGLLFLSLSRTARDVYATPELLGIVVLLGLWFGKDTGERDRFDRICLQLTVALAVFVGAVLILVGAGIPILQGVRIAAFPLCVGLVSVATIIWLLFQSGRNLSELRNVMTGWTIYAAGIVIVCTVLFPALDASQDLRPTARAVAAEFRSRSIGILHDDETMRAYLDFGAGIAARDLRDLNEATNWLKSDENHVLLIELATDHVTPTARARLTSWNERWGRLAPFDSNPNALELQSRGLRLLSQYTVIGGRTYGVLAQPKP